MLLALLLSVLCLSHPSLALDVDQMLLSQQTTARLTFSTIHEHGQALPKSAAFDGEASVHPLVVFNDYSNGTPHGVQVENDTEGQWTIKTRPMKVRRPRSQVEFHLARQESMRDGRTRMMDWDDIEVLGPDTEDRETLLELAKMTGNAYALDSGSKRWYPLDGKWNNSTPFGWDVDDDGFRGHVFATPDNSTVVLSIKGTTLKGGGPTAGKDKLNDNRLFSCCCGYVDWTWRMNVVCDCWSRGYKCDTQCLREALQEESIFYNSGIALYNNLTYMYPTANIWIIGHSLGGALASLLGTTFGAPVVTFESPGERLAAQRLHLPLPPPSKDEATTYHVYHTADPIPCGGCTGYSSLCHHGRYAMETKCHLGNVIKYDTVSKLGWKRGSLTTHPIKVVITQILHEDWEPTEMGGRAVPKSELEENCTECLRWDFSDPASSTGPSVILLDLRH